MCNCGICVSKRQFIRGCKKIPIELLNYIFSYTYTPQLPGLLCDIRDYTESKQIIYEIYGSIYYTPTLMHQRMVYHLFLITNNYLDYLQDGFLHNFYEIWMRNLRLQTIDDVDIFVTAILERINQTTVFSLFWGLMNKKERKLFIDISNNFAEM